MIASQVLGLLGQPRNKRREKEWNPFLPADVCHEVKHLWGNLMIFQRNYARLIIASCALVSFFVLTVQVGHVLRVRGQRQRRPGRPWWPAPRGHQAHAHWSPILERDRGPLPRLRQHLWSTKKRINACPLIMWLNSIIAQRVENISNFTNVVCTRTHLFAINSTSGKWSYHSYGKGQHGVEWLLEWRNCQKWDGQSRSPLINCPAAAFHSPAIDDCIFCQSLISSIPIWWIDCSSPWSDARCFLIPFASRQFIVQQRIWVCSDRTFLRTLMVNFKNLKLGQYHIFFLFQLKLSTHSYWFSAWSIYHNIEIHYFFKAIWFAFFRQTRLL